MNVFEGQGGRGNADVNMLKLDQLPERAKLAEWLAAAGLDEDLPAVMAAYDSGALGAPANLAALRTCYQKAWLDGTGLTRDDFAGITVDRMLLIKILLALLAPLIRARHAELGLPSDVTGESCRALGNSSRAMAEFPDAYIKSLYWAGKYYRETMFKTGIFVYLLANMSEKLPAWGFCNRNTGEVAALASDGVAVDDAGLVCGDNAAPAFITRMEQSSGKISGNRIAPAGRILRERAELNAAEWETVMAPRMCAATVHIPPGRPMLPDDCDASLRAAAQIIRRHLPGHGVKSFTCTSWILNPDWLTLLPDSNMAQFMRKVFLFPIKSTPTAGIDFVFRQAAGELDLKTAPRKSRLQRIMLEHLEQNKPLHAGGMFLPLAGKRG